MNVTSAGMTGDADSPPRGTGWGVAALIIALAVVLAAAAGWENFATADEPYHLLAAWTYVAEGHGDFNPEHPPAAKLLAGAGLLPLKLRGAGGDPVQRLENLSLEIRRFLHRNSAPWTAILRAGRLAMLPFLVLLLVGVYLWARELAGAAAGLLALVAAASQPLVLGHAFVVHTDVAAAATWVWTLRATQRWLHLGGRRWVAVGLWLGAALLVKFAAVYLALGIALLTLALAWRRQQPRLLAGLAGAALVAAATIPLGYAPVLRNASAREVAATWSAYLRSGPATRQAVEKVAHLPLVGPGIVQWSTGLGYVARTNRMGQGINYFFGRTSTRGFWLYFPVAFVLKISLPFLVLVAVAMLHLRTVQGFALLPALAGVYYLLISLGSSYNIGARHLLPMVALAAVAVGVAAARWRRVALLTATLTLMASPLLSFPHYLAHFNGLVGAERGARVLADSNLDWGQDWQRAARLATRSGWTPITIVYLGSADPAALFPGGIDFFASPTRTPYVALSRQAAVVGAEYLAALREPEAARALTALLAEVERHGQPLATVGNSIIFYRLRSLSDSSAALSPAARRLRMSQESALD